MFSDRPISGWCRNKANLKLQGVEPSDTTNPMWTGIGLAIHKHFLGILGETFPNWLVDSVKVTTTFEDGYEITGTPDVIVPDWNLLGDLKTVDGFDWVRRVGISQNYAFQRHLYLLGALESGLLSRDKEILLAEMYVDRSGRERDLMVVFDEVDWTLTDRVWGWLADVRDAARNKRFASKDVPAPICERTCEYFRICRGGDLPKDPDEAIDDPMLVEAAQFYRDGLAREKEGASMKAQAKKLLEGVNGRTEKHSVRWTEVEETFVDGFRKAAHWRLDVRDIRK